MKSNTVCAAPMATIAGCSVAPCRCGTRRADREMVWTCTDIHELKVAEREISRTNRELHESNEKFHQLAANITDAFWIRSPDMREVQYVSPAFERIWGRSVESLRAAPHQWTEFVLAEDRERVRDAFAALVGGKSNLDIAYRITRPDGAIRWFQVRGFQVRDADGELIRHIGIVTDFTERKLAELATERMLRRLTTRRGSGRSGTGSGISPRRRSPGRPKCSRLSGATRRLGPPRDYEENEAIYDEASQALLKERVTRAMESGEAQEYELRGHRPNGEQIDVLGRAMPLRDESGQVPVSTEPFRTSLRGSRPTRREPGSLRSSTPPAMPSSAKRSTVSSPVGMAGQNACLGIGPRKSLASPSPRLFRSNAGGRRRKSWRACAGRKALSTLKRSVLQKAGGRLRSR